MSTVPLARIEFSERDYTARKMAHICRAEAGDDFFEVPEALVAAYEAADAAWQAAEEAIARYVADHDLAMQDGFVAAGWVTS